MSEDHRAPDQDAALEQAFVAGVLPEEDRRTPPPASPPDIRPIVDVDVTAGPFQGRTAKDIYGEDVAALIDRAQSETGYAQAQAFADLRKRLGI